MPRRESKPQRAGPTPAEFVQRARQLAPSYTVALQPTTNGWLAKCVEIPTAFAIESTREKALRAIERPLVLILATQLELGRPVPAPLAEGKRDAQVNVKLTADERLLLEGTAKRQGFKGLSDFFRHAALEAARSAA